jgi:phosphoribosylaminoimidazolecarboxamide formyltransferase/IMP cyclohydrolase
MPAAPALAPIRRALISVSDKTGLVDFARALADGGSTSCRPAAPAARCATRAAVTDVADVTGFPEMMDGRVKTLHPMVHGGLLALRDEPEAHVAAMETHGIGAIDLLVVNLYPFEATVARGADYATAIENIDIGGPAMIRAAAKNHAHVAVVVDVEDYGKVIAALDAHDGGTQLRLPAARWRRSPTPARRPMTRRSPPGWRRRSARPRRAAAPLPGTLAQPLRYGENPHQSAAFYLDGSGRPGVATATQHQGKELSYNNINDTDAAFELVSEFHPDDGPVCAIIKHANPCGVARGATLAEAYSRAFDCDRTSAFGGIVALNQTLDAETAEADRGDLHRGGDRPGRDRRREIRLREEEEPAATDDRGPALAHDTGADLPAGVGRYSRAGQGRGPDRGGEAARGHPPPPLRPRDGGHDLRMVGWPST